MDHDMPTCQCAEPEPALVKHGMDSVCERCGELIAPVTEDAREAYSRWKARLTSAIERRREVLAQMANTIYDASPVLRDLIGNAQKVRGVDTPPNVD